jgi:hypothetical protein
MSYLDVPRIHFSGDFQADPSTLNNSCGSCCTAGSPRPSSLPPEQCNYNNAGTSQVPGWNAQGKHFFALRTVTVRRALDAKGAVKSVAADDPVIGSTVSGSLARLVDLDQAVQSASQIWGLDVTVSDSSGNGFTGTMSTATLRDLWPGRAPGGFAGGFGGTYQSVLKNVKWTPATGALPSPVLQALKTASPTQLSIRLAAYAYDAVAGFPPNPNPNFTIARLVGTIGPSLAGDLDFVPNARRMINAAPAQGIFGDAPYKVDAARGRVVIDLSNSIPEVAPAGERVTLGTVEAQINLPTPRPAVTLGTLDVSRAHSLDSAGIEEVPITSAQVTQLKKRPLQIRASPPAGARLILAERADGLDVDASEIVARLNPTEQQDVDLIATRFGAPAGGVELTLAVLAGLPMNGLTLASVSGSTATPVALAGSPPSGKVKTAANGRAKVRLVAKDPGHPRQHMDGQVYVIGVYTGSGSSANLRTQLSVHVYEARTIPAAPKWNDVKEILTQYSRLYPAMTQVLDLSDLGKVSPKRGEIARRLRLPETDSTYMPSTRDLSRDWKAILLKWLDAGAPP